LIDLPADPRHLLLDWRICGLESRSPSAASAVERRSQVLDRELLIEQLLRHMVAVMFFDVMSPAWPGTPRCPRPSPGETELELRAPRQLGAAHGLVDDAPAGALDLARSAGTMSLISPTAIEIEPR